MSLFQGLNYTQEVFLGEERCPNHFRRSPSPQIPLWVAPNLLTGVGFLVNFATVLPLLLLDTNLEGVAPSWLYVAAGAGFFIYQSLDAIDGKQARRTGSANQLGELFDHGCDAVSMFLILMSGASAVGIHDYPISLLVFVVLLNQVNFVYHWQTFVSGTLHFNLLATKFTLSLNLLATNFNVCSTLKCNQLATKLC